MLKGIQGGMQLPGSKMVPSFASLREYGNTSCSTTWYVMSYLETCDKVKRGDRVMQVCERPHTQIAIWGSGRGGFGQLARGSAESMQGLLQCTLMRAAAHIRGLNVCYSVWLIAFALSPLGHLAPLNHLCDTHSSSHPGCQYNSSTRGTQHSGGHSAGSPRRAPPIIWSP